MNAASTPYDPVQAGQAAQMSVSAAGRGRRRETRTGRNQLRRSNIGHNRINVTSWWFLSVLGWCLSLVLVWRGYRRATTLPSRWGAK
jgi:hypothetical protein